LSGWFFDAVNLTFCETNPQKTVPIGKDRGANGPDV
jgi:hypothetical protein